MNLKSKIFLKIFTLLLIFTLLSNSTKSDVNLTQFASVGIYYSENLRMGQVYNWNVTDFQFNDTIWILRYSHFDLGSNISIELTADDIGNFNYFNTTTSSYVENIDHSKITNILIDGIPIDPLLYDNDAYTIDLELLKYSWTSSPSWSYYPVFSFFNALYTLIDDGNIVDTLTRLFWVNNFTQVDNEITIYFNRDLTEGIYSYEQHEIFTYNLDYGVFTEVTNQFIINSPLNASGITFSYTFELTNELVTPASVPLPWLTTSSSTSSNTASSSLITTSDSNSITSDSDLVSTSSSDDPSQTKDTVPTVTSTSTTTSENIDTSTSQVPLLLSIPFTTVLLLKWTRRRK